ncbi:MAG: ABC transporter permease [Treponema sp.]|nr:ABC transporter permease [Treponema sp.]
MSDILFSSVPLILASLGALFSEYAGILAVFMDGVINFSAFLTFALYTGSSNIFVSVVLSVLICVLIIFCFAWITEKSKMNPFLSATAINLIFSSFTSLLSSIIFHTRGVLTSKAFVFDYGNVKWMWLCLTVLISVLSVLFLFKTPHGLYLRITGSDSDVLDVKGVSSARCRIYAWMLSAGFAALSGAVLCLRINSFVPNISAGRGWIALAAVFIGQKKIWRVVIAVIIFCAADYLGITLQAVLPGSALNALPYFAALLLISIPRYNSSYGSSK